MTSGSQTLSEQKNHQVLVQGTGSWTHSQTLDSERICGLRSPILSNPTLIPMQVFWGPTLSTALSGLCPAPRSEALGGM